MNIPEQHTGVLESAPFQLIKKKIISSLAFIYLSCFIARPRVSAFPTAPSHQIEKSDGGKQF
jgi:hypothetical protein